MKLNEILQNLNKSENLTEKELTVIESRVYAGLVSKLNSQKIIQMKKPFSWIKFSSASLFVLIVLVGCVYAYPGIVKMITPNKAKSTMEIANERIKVVTNGLTAKEVQRIDLIAAQSGVAEGELGSVNISIEPTQSVTKPIVNEDYKKQMQNLLSNSNYDSTKGYVTETVTTTPFTDEAYKEFASKYGQTMTYLPYNDLNGKTSTFINTSEKSFMSISDKKRIDSLYLSSNNSQLSYLGGKYAIKTNYVSSNVVTEGSSSYFEQNQSVELSLLKEILFDTNVKEVGLESIGGANYYVFEIYNDNPITDEEGNLTGKNVYITNKAYLREKDFSLAKVEVLVDDTLVNTTEFIKSQSLSKEEADSLIISYISSLNVPIKEININNSIVASTKSYLNTVDVLYVDNYKDVQSFYSTKEYELSYKEMNDLVMSVDYDPNYVEVSGNDQYKNFSPDYSYSLKYVSIYIYGHELTEDDSYYTGVDPNSTEIERKSVKVNVGDSIVNGEYINYKMTINSYLSTEDDSVSAGETQIDVYTQLLKFKVGNNTYLMSSMQYPEMVCDGDTKCNQVSDYIVNNEVNFQKLTSAQADEIDLISSQGI